MKKLSRPSKPSPTPPSPSTTTPSTSLNRSQQLLKSKPILTPTPTANIPPPSSLISTMKLQLSSIKHDVQKLMNDQIDQNNLEYTTTKQQLRIEEYLRENQRLQGKCERLVRETEKIREEKGELEERLEEVRKEKRRVEEERSRLEKESSNVSHKLSSQKIALEKQNLQVKEQVRRLKQEMGGISEEGKWKEAWVELSGQVTLLEQEVKEKQSQIEGKDQEILQLGWELQDIKEQKGGSEKKVVRESNGLIEAEFEKYRQEVKVREEKREQEREIERQREREREDERVMERENERQRQRERKNEQQKEIQRNNERQIEREKIESLEKNNLKLNQVINELRNQLESSSKIHSKDMEQITFKNKQLEVQLQRQRNQVVEMRTRNFNLVTESQRLEQCISKLNEQVRNSVNSASEQNKKYLDEITKLKTKITQQQILNLKLQNSLTLTQSETPTTTTTSINFIKQTQLLHQLNQKTNQIISLKNEISQTKKALSFFKKPNMKPRKQKSILVKRQQRIMLRLS